MHEKKVKFGKEARDKVFNGVEILYKAVSSTLGPMGKNVLIARPETGPHITKDGVTVAQELILEDPWENAGATLIKEAANLSGKNSGDGTTTATILAYKIIKEGLQLIEDGIAPLNITKGIESMEKKLLLDLQQSSIKVSLDSERLEQVATISANNSKELGKIVAEAVRKADTHGVVMVEENQGYGTYVECVEGFRFDKGYESRFFINNVEEATTMYENCYLLFVDDMLDKPRALIKALDVAVQAKQPVAIIAKEFKPEVIAFLAANVQYGNKIVAIKAPGHASNRAELMEDMATLTGGYVFSNSKPTNLEECTLEHLGRCGKIVSTNEYTTILDGAGDPKEVEARITSIKTQMDATKSDFDKEKLQDRFSKLTGGVAIVYVGGNSEVEVREKKDRVDDAVAATIAAVEEGIVPGGGVALIKIANKYLLDNYVSNDLDETEVLLATACFSPCLVLLNNANTPNANEILEEIILGDETVGYNALTGKVCDLLACGVIDPVKVTRMALENACSVAKTYLTCNTVMVFSSEFNK